MTRALPFTQAALRRVIRAAEKAGYRVGGVRPDGTVLVYSGDERPQDLSIVPDHGKDKRASRWGEVKA